MDKWQRLQQAIHDREEEIQISQRIAATAGRGMVAACRGSDVATLRWVLKMMHRIAVSEGRLKRNVTIGTAVAVR